MQKYSLKNKTIENMKQGEPGEQGERKFLHALRAYSLSNHIQWKRRNTQKTLKTLH